jgi:hypothetical protein
VRDSASIRIRDDHTEVLFEWLDFDGDDSFADFHIKITTGTESRRFDFGPCVVWGIRKAVRFFQDKLEVVSGGFRFPDIRSYDLTRAQEDVLLQIRYEGTGLSEEVLLIKPRVAIDDKFLKEYDGDS